MEHVPLMVEPGEDPEHTEEACSSTGLETQGGPPERAGRCNWGEESMDLSAEAAAPVTRIQINRPEIADVEYELIGHEDIKVDCSVIQ